MIPNRMRDLCWYQFGYNGIAALMRRKRLVIRQNSVSLQLGEAAFGKVDGHNHRSQSITSRLSTMLATRLLVGVSEYTCISRCQSFDKFRTHF